MVKLNDIFVFIQKTELEKFDSETDAFIIFQFVFETFFVAESRTVNHLDGFAVEKDFFITDIWQNEREDNAQTDNDDYAVKQPGAD